MAQQLKAEQAVSSLTTTGSYRWVVCALLFFATTINYMDRQILSLLKPILDNQLHWTNEEFGAINRRLPGRLRYWRVALRIFGRSAGKQNRLRSFDYGLESRGARACAKSQVWAGL